MKTNKGASMIKINDIEHGIFRHQCETLGCDIHIIYDDEPFCFVHSPDSGSSIRGYSALENNQYTWIKYTCQFPDWDGFMDGTVTTYSETFDCDFVDIDHKDDDYDEDVVLDPFTEASARAWFESKGYGNVEFIY